MVLGGFPDGGGAGHPVLIGGNAPSTAGGQPAGLPAGRDFRVRIAILGATRGQQGQSSQTKRESFHDHLNVTCYVKSIFLPFQGHARRDALINAKH